MVITGTINEQLQASDFIVRCHDLSNGTVSATVSTSTGAFSVTVPDAPHYVVVLADVGSIWSAGLAVSAGDKIFPTNPKTVPFYYVATNSGTTGTIEPSWITSPQSQTADNGIIWDIVEHLPQPVAHSPIINPCYYPVGIS